MRTIPSGHALTQSEQPLHASTNSASGRAKGGLSGSGRPASLRKKDRRSMTGIPCDRCNYIAECFTMRLPCLDHGQTRRFPFRLVRRPDFSCGARPGGPYSAPPTACQPAELFGLFLAPGTLQMRGTCPQPCRAGPQGILPHAHQPAQFMTPRRRVADGGGQRRSVSLFFSRPPACFGCPRRSFGVRRLTTGIQ